LLLLDTDKDTAANTFRAMPRLWQPDPMVAQVLLPILLQNAAQHNDNDDNATQDKDDGSSTVVETSEIWDLGAGSGRDVCFLAEQLKERLSTTTTTDTNTRVVGLDQRYQETNEECAHFWNRRGVGDCTAYNRIRLEDWDAFEACLQSTQQQNNSTSRVACLFAVRFWNRPLVERIVSSPLIKPGCIFAISQFGKPSPDATWDFVHPKVRII
jgi:hypothetical protein